MTFWHYLMLHIDEESRVGDLARDASYDERFPRDVETWAKLNGYLWSRQACDEAIESAKEAMACWRLHERRIRQR